ncbi:MAG: hypothetical protein QW483_02645, partial [Nanopusillaceae archaeon]
MREQLRKSHLKEVFSRLHYIRSELSDLSNTLCDIIDDICSYYLDFLIEKKENEIKKLEEEAGLRSQQRGIFQPSKQPTPAPLYYIDEYLKKLYQVREILNTIRSIILKSLNQLDRTYLQDYQDYNKILDYVRYFENFIGIWEFLIENFIKPYINDNDIKEDLEKYKPDYIELEKKLEDINNKFKDLHEIIIKIEIYLLDIIEEFKKYEYIGEQVSEVYLKKVEVNLKKIFDRLNSLKSELSVLLNTLYDILDQICRYYLEPLMEKKENEIKKSEKEAGLRSQQRGIFQFLKQPTPPSQPPKQPAPPSQPPKQPAPPSQPPEQPTELSQKIKKREKFKEKFKEIKKKGEKLPIVSIITFVSYIILLYLLFVSGNILTVLTIFVILVIIIGLISKKSLSWIVQGAILGSIIMIVIYILFYTTFSYSICIFMPSFCPQKISLSAEEQISGIRKTIEETINRIKFIIENPELAYIESRAESVAARDSYRYMFEIEDINKLPIDYTFYSDSDSTIKLSTKYLYYAIKSSLPINSNIKMYFNAYCLTRPIFKLDCLTSNSLLELGRKVIYDNIEFFFDEKNNFYRNNQVPEYGIQNIRCTVPTIYINISNCEEILYKKLYFQNNFLVLISNITTRTIYKFLVVDESVLINSFYENKDIYAYLKLDKREYDLGYFDGFLDFPKINILRLGVLSEYPVIRFRNLNEVSDTIYISLKNINELYDISNFEIEIKYNPNHIKISLDPQFKGIQTAIYDLTCKEYIEKINCKVNFKKIPDDFDRNKYIILYKNENFDKFFFFIPIVISFVEFVEYSEVIITA